MASLALFIVLERFLIPDNRDDFFTCAQRSRIVSYLFFIICYCYYYYYYYYYYYNYYSAFIKNFIAGKLCDWKVTFTATWLV